jgi:hypothetical protein
MTASSKLPSCVAKSTIAHERLWTRLERQVILDLPDESASTTSRKSSNLPAEPILGARKNSRISAVLDTDLVVLLRFKRNSRNWASAPSEAARNTAGRHLMGRPCNRGDKCGK